MRLKHLEMALQRLQGFSRPNARLEQYQTPAPLAARLLYDAFMKGDIEGKWVCDLGSGTGVLAIGAALLGANASKGVEIDEKAIEIARGNAGTAGVHIEFIAADIRGPVRLETLSGCDTVIMNPPFGAQSIHTDRPFIDLALAIAPVTYGIFNAGSIQFIETYIRGRAGVSEKTRGILPVKRIFSFHTRDVKEIEVEILRLVRNP